MHLVFFDAFNNSHCPHLLDLAKPSKTETFGIWGTVCIEKAIKRPWPYSHTSCNITVCRVTLCGKAVKGLEVSQEECVCQRSVCGMCGFHACCCVVR